MMLRLSIILVLFHIPAAWAADSLPSWNEGKTKAAIVQFVEAVSTEKNPGFVPVEERIAVFDLDGTLMNEKPIFLQAQFLNHLTELAVYKDPKMADDPDVHAFLSRLDWNRYFKETPLESTMKVYALTHTGFTQEVFAGAVQDYLQAYSHLSRTTYQPMRELLAYLDSKGFRNYIVTGSENQFVRGFAEEFFGIPPERVIGTSWKTALEEQPDGTLTIKRLPEIGHYNDKQSKVLAIDLHIGRKPIFAAGNDGNAGDIYMLRYATQAAKRPGFGLIISHDDSSRETAYTDEKGNTAAAVAKYGWTNVSVREDWKTIFPAVSALKPASKR